MTLAARPVWGNECTPSAMFSGANSSHPDRVPSDCTVTYSAQQWTSVSDSTWPVDIDTPFHGEFGFPTCPNVPKKTCSYNEGYDKHLCPFEDKAARIKDVLKLKKDANHLIPDGAERTAIEALGRAAVAALLNEAYAQARGLVFELTALSPSWKQAVHDTLEQYMTQVCGTAKATKTTTAALPSTADVAGLTQTLESFCPGAASLPGQT
jgi:hypothetical protein